MEKELKSEVLDDQKEEMLPILNYTPDEIVYLSGLQTRLELSRNQRDIAHDEFDGMDYVTRYEDEERIANSYIPPKKNKSDTNFITGTIRAKGLALLSAINALNLEPDHSAYDKNNILIDELGNAMNIIRQKADEVDEDEEKKLMRQWELLKHGSVFIEEAWKVEWRKAKKLNGKFDGKATGVNWQTKLEKVYENPCRTVLDGRSVYLGDIKQPFISLQPYIFTIDDISYEQAKSIYGDWERWKYVGKKLKPINQESEAGSGMAYGNWRLLKATQENRVEVVKYQDKWSNEFQILLNGIPMLPIGFPMPWQYGEYNIAQQNLEFIHPHFSYGRSFVSRLKVQAALLDEMLRLAVLKTQKSFMPPRANNTGRVLSKNIFMPGTITMGLNPAQVSVLSEKDGEGLLRGELECLKLLTESIDQNSVNPTFAGQKTTGNPTATEVLELQRQAKMVLGLTVFAAAMLEKKLGQLRLFNLLENWFNPIDTELDTARGIIKNRYRVANVSKNVEGEGMGSMMVIPTDDGQMFPLAEEDQMAMSENIYKEEEKSSTPTRKFYLNRKELQAVKLTWKTTVNPTETGGSERSKLLFERMLQSASNLGLQANPDQLIQRFAETWQENPKLFAPPAGMPPESVVAAGINPGGMKKPAQMSPQMGA